MRKYVLSIFLLLIAATAMSQKKSVVNLVHSQSSTGIKLNGKDVIKVYQGVFKQDYSTLTSDSAYFYVQDNAVDAFGHVIINQGDTLNIYSDKLNYNGNTKIAILTDNVRMVDKDATLTTNHLTYNTATRIGVYTDGGKLVNKENVLVSKNGYYFAFTRDSYFRYDVSLTTPDILVKTDTMRYNTGTKIAYFYGPTNIYSIPKKDEKNKQADTLYTENGYYNTVVEQAAFGKNNMYRSGTKSLKGDSLFYDKLKGYGRAVMNVTFEDKEQKTTIKGNLGTYFKENELTVMTQDPYVIMVTEQKDTTKSDSVTRADSIAKADSVLKKKPSKGNSAITMNEVIKNTIPGKTGNIKPPAGTMAIKADSLIKTVAPAVKDIVIKNAQAISTQITANKGTPLKPDSVLKQLSAQSKKPGGAKTATAKNKPADKNTKPTDTTVAAKDTSHLKRDSIYMSADTIETQILTYKDLKIYQEKQRLAHIRDTTSKPKPKKPKGDVKESKLLIVTHAWIQPDDSSFYHHDYFGKPKPKYVAKKPKKPPTKKQLEQDSIRKVKLDDSIATAKRLEPSDTARIRIIIAHHHFKLFKSDLQSKSDSMFYSNADSTIRCYVNPMMWTEGSQLSGDTIYLQMKHKKLDNMRLFPHAFAVNVEKKDSATFNQLGGKLMRGFFKDDKLHRVFIEGNAESIYFSRDSATNKISGMQRSISSRIRVDFKNNQVTNLAFYTKPENKYGPLNKFKEDDKVLKGFIWKPKDRPVSKESIIPSFNKKATAPAAKPTDKGQTAKTGGKSNGKKGAKGKPTTNGSKPVTLPGKLPIVGKDSTAKLDTTKQQPLKTAKDSVRKIDSLKKAP